MLLRFCSAQLDVDRDQLNTADWCVFCRLWWWWRSSNVAYSLLRVYSLFFVCGDDCDLFHSSVTQICILCKYVLRESRLVSFLLPTGCWLRFISPVKLEELHVHLWYMYTSWCWTARRCSGICICHDAGLHAAVVYQHNCFYICNWKCLHMHKALVFGANDDVYVAYSWVNAIVMDISKYLCSISTMHLGSLFFDLQLTGNIDLISFIQETHLIFHVCIVIHA